MGFTVICASNGPKVHDPEAVEQTLARYVLGMDLNIGVSFDHEDGRPYLYVYGGGWPEAWPVPAGIEADNFDPFTEDYFEAGGEGFKELLIEIAAFLEEPLTVHAIGSTCGRFPLSATEWYVTPGGSEVEINEFQHGSVEPVSVAT
jgi:hypothetical protein